MDLFFITLNLIVRFIWFPSYLRHSDVMLTRWLPSTEASTIPEYASHTIGVGGFVMNDKNEVLVVSGTKHPLLVTQLFRKVLWRRKTMETTWWIRKTWRISSTSSHSRSEGRNWHRYWVSECFVLQTHAPSSIQQVLKRVIITTRSDMYFIVRLKPLTQNITREEAEIMDCTWMDVRNSYICTKKQNNRKLQCNFLLFLLLVCECTHTSPDKKVQRWHWSELYKSCHCKLSVWSVRQRVSCTCSWTYWSWMEKVLLWTVHNQGNKMTWGLNRLYFWHLKGWPNVKDGVYC